MSITALREPIHVAFCHTVDVFLLNKAVDPDQMVSWNREQASEKLKQAFSGVRTVEVRTEYKKIRDRSVMVVIATGEIDI